MTTTTRAATAAMAAAPLAHLVPAVVVPDRAAAVPVVGRQERVAPVAAQARLEWLAQRARAVALARLAALVCLTLAPMHPMPATVVD